ADRLRRMARELRDEWEPRLAIVVEGILPMPPILGALRRFGERGVPTRVALRIEHLAGVRERFVRERADLMLSIDYVGDAHHVAEPLPPISMLLLARADHPVLNAGGVDRARLAEHVELIVEDSARDAEPRTGRLSLGSPQVFRLSDFHTKRQALLAGVGFGWMPEHLVQQDLRSGALTRVGFVEGDEYVFTPQLVTRRRDPGRSASLFLELLAEETKRDGTSRRTNKKDRGRR
ncbi:MAG: hypothetical protein KC776_13640, partial [Myxococcales bacterium]|nr:hypothetical protein [Myxococcales bacterium]